LIYRDACIVGKTRILAIEKNMYWRYQKSRVVVLE